MNYHNFIYFTDKNKELLKQFYSYELINEKKIFLDKINTDDYTTYLDFDRIIKVPDSISDDELSNWIIENWKITSTNKIMISNSNGICFFTKDGPACYLVKKMSEIIKEKIKLLYFCDGESLCGEYFAYPDKDPIHLVYKPIDTAPEQIIQEIKTNLV